MVRQNFNPEYIKEELTKIDTVLVEKLNIYLLGGAVMAINDLKPGTKDIDVLVEKIGIMKPLLLLLKQTDISSCNLKICLSSIWNSLQLHWKT